jgi:hypothetical protein
MQKQPIIEYNVQYGDLLVDSFFINDPYLFEIFKKGLPPKEAYYYFPKGKEIIDLHKKKPEKHNRRIFINVPFLEVENNWLEKFKEIIASHPENKLPEYWNDGLNLAYIYSVECKLDKAYERMINYFKWYKSFFPLNIQPGDNCVKVLNSGFLYIFGRDHQFRPLIICQPYILQDCLNKYSDSDIMNASIFICQYIANYMLIPGQIENWIMIVNMDGTSVLSLPDSVKKLINNMSEYFIARLYRCYILGLNAFLRIIYKIICNFVEKTTVEKVIILDNKDDPRKHNDINPENLEERFGGKAQNCIYDQENSLFPPRMPSNNFFLENENPEDILITEEEYIERYNAGKIPIKSASPYIVEKIRKEKAEKEKEEIARKKREEAQSRMAEAKTRAQLNIFTSWISSNESFDLNKFKTKSNRFIEKVNAFRIKKDRLCNNISELNEPIFSDDGNFE